MIIKDNTMHLFEGSVNFFGFKISPNGIGVVAEYVSTILQIRPPASVAQARSFLGQMNHNRRFIPRYAKITRSVIDTTNAANQRPDKKIPQSQEFLQAV